MNKFVLIGAGVACAMASAQADAATWVFSFNGKISTQYAVDSKFDPIPVPTMPISIGDAVSGSVTFEDRRSNSDHSGDNTGAQFFFPGGQNFALNIGEDLQYSSVPGEQVFTKLVIQNDKVLNGSKFDAFSIDALLWTKMPFASTSSTAAVLFNYSVYDFFSAAALSSAEIEDLQPLTNFTSLGSMYIGFNDNGIGGTGQIVNMNLSGITASLTRIDAVPEPATWAMMLIGFGMIGAAARYRRRSITARYA